MAPMVTTMPRNVAIGVISLTRRSPREAARRLDFDAIEPSTAASVDTSRDGARAEERLEEVVIGIIDRAVDLAVFGEIAGGVLEDEAAVGAGFSQIRLRGEAAQLRLGKGRVTRRRDRIAREAGEFEER